jgi:hypothetical protein
MMRADSTRRAVSVVDGVLTIEGVPGRFRQSPARPLTLEVTELSSIAGFGSRQGGVSSLARIQGRARIVEAQLGRAGFDERTDEFALSIVALPADAENRMLLRLGFTEADEQREEPAAFFGEIVVPAAVYAELRSDLRNGEAERLSVGAATSLWLAEADHEARPGFPVSWHLGIDAEGQATTEAKGLVQSLTWTTRPTKDAQPAIFHAAEHPSDEEDEPVEERKLRQLRGISRWLMNLVIVLIAIMFVIAFK